VNGRPLAAHSPRAVRDVLLRFGWDEVRADAAAGSVEPVVLLLEGVPEAAIEALVGFNQKIGIDLLTGEGWVLLAGSRSRLAAFARPWQLPPELAPLATSIGLALPGERIATWRTARGPLALDHPLILGILNLTPDSFSDGGRFVTIDAALAQADRLLEQGADLLDLGGESTRPGAVPVDTEEEASRVLPLLDALVRRHPSVHVSIDTVKAEVARRATASGAAIINDVSGFRLDPEMAAAARDSKAGVILMHSRGSVADMATMAHADYGDDPVGTVLGELHRSLRGAIDGGVTADAIVVDPGLGFSKTAEQTLAVLDQLAVISSLNRPILVGPSRKRFLGFAAARPVEDRDRATATACVLAFERGAQLFRVHNPAIVREALSVASAVRGR
jgi:dihydropteroate synthase